MDFLNIHKEVAPGSGISEKKRRYGLLDTIRGATLISMILYHGTWDLVYLFGLPLPWYEGIWGYIWQQSICMTFIFLSGFCWSLGKRHVRRGLLVFGGGAVIMLATRLFMPENQVVFGVLTLIGTCMLLMIPLHKLIRGFLEKKGVAAAGLMISLFLFLLVRNVNEGFLGYEGFRLVALPGEWYRNTVSAFLGFPHPGFFSTDYFSLFPWLFLFAGGYFLFHFLSRKSALEGKGGLSPVFTRELSFFSKTGRYSLPVYLLHQPVLYLLLSLFLFCCNQWIR